MCETFDYEIVDKTHLLSVDEGVSSPYDWVPPHFTHYPPAKDLKLPSVPWARPTQAAMSIVGANIIDVENSKVLENRTIKLKEGKIESISKSLASDMQEEGYTSVDAKGFFICPGLIDCHVHITAPPGGTGTRPGPMASQVDLALKTSWVLKGMLSRGFTTVRDVGGANKHYANATAQWLIPGPRLFQGGPIISQTGGHGDSIHDPDAPIDTAQIAEPGYQQKAIVADGVDACLKAARRIMMGGADHIKICSSGGVMSLTDTVDSEQFTIEEIKAICDTVRKMGGTGVASHCFTSQGARNAIEAGIWSIEHGNLIDEETFKLMAKKGVHYTPTLSVGELVQRPPFDGPLVPSSRPKAERITREGRKALLMAHKAGVNIAYGTDHFLNMQSCQLGEFVVRAEVLPSPVVLKHATCNAAKVIKMEGKVGCIKEGAFADLLFLTSNPLEDVTILNEPHRYLKGIMKEGRVVHSHVDGLRVEIPLV